MKRILTAIFILLLPLAMAGAEKSGKVRIADVSNDLDTTTDLATVISNTCDSGTDYSYILTGDLLCANTGNINTGGATGGFLTVSIGIYHINSAATDIKVQCAEANAVAGPWYLVTRCTSSGTCTNDERTEAVTGDKAFKFHFEVNDKWTRCRVWGTSAAAGDKVTAKVRLMADGGGI